MGKALFIVGSTSTGKTKLALQISKAIPSMLISADSRQVYIGMDIGTGKDKPKDGTPIALLDQVRPNEDWSVAHFEQEAKRLAKKAWSEGKLPIFVGGTGLYLQELVEQYETVSVPQNTQLRALLEKQTTQDLQKMLYTADPDRLSSMNNSDKNNPRRLIRAILSIFGLVAISSMSSS
jgi:tRNA dimethylallyltransferase